MRTAHRQHPDMAYMRRAGGQGGGRRAAMRWLSRSGTRPPSRAGTPLGDAWPGPWRSSPAPPRCSPSQTRRSCWPQSPRACWSVSAAGTASCGPDACRWAWSGPADRSTLYAGTSARCRTPAGTLRGTPAGPGGRRSRRRCTGGRMVS